MKQQKNWYTTPMLSAFTWFGFHCGSGFASGTQLKIYAAKFGAMGILAPIVAWVSCALFIGIVTEYSRLIKAKSYRDVGNTIYWDNPIVGRVAIFIWDLMVFSAMIVSAGACVSGLGTLLKSLFNFPYYVGCMAFVVFMIGLICFGNQIVIRLGKVTTPMIVLFVIIAVAGIMKGLPTLSEVLMTDRGSALVEGSTLGSVAWSGFTYGCIQISFLHTASIIGGSFESRKQTWLFVIIGFAINLICMLLGVLTILAHYPECMNSEMPMLYIVTCFSDPLKSFLMVVYNLVLLMAYITTVGSLLTGAIARYRPIIQKAVKSELASKAIIIVVIMSGAALLSALGLEGVLTMGYGTLAKLKMPLWFFPIIILGPINIWRLCRKQKKDAR